MNKSRLKRCAKFFLILAVTTFLAVRLYYYLTDDFRLSNITYDMPYHPEWNLPTPSAEEERHIAKILDQPYTYMTKGAQSYVFGSADGEYVLKFFKFKHLRPNFFVNSLPDIGPIADYKEKQTARKERKLAGVFQSHIIAFEKIHDESGLIFLQMNTKNNPQRFVTIYDKMGFKHVINLETYQFVLQKRGTTLQDTLNRLLKEGDVATAKSKIDQMFALFAKEYALGIYDEDHGVYRNMGFIGNSPTHLDVGELLADESIKDPEKAKKQALHVGKKLKNWVHQNHKIYSKVLGKHIDKSIETYITAKNDAASKDP